MLFQSAARPPRSLPTPSTLFFHLRETLPPLRLFPLPAPAVTHPTATPDSNYTFFLEQHQADTGDPPADGSWAKEEERGDRIGGGKEERREWTPTVH